MLKQLWVPYFLAITATGFAFSCSINRGNRLTPRDDTLASEASGTTSDNTRGRARVNGGLTPTDQGESEADVQTTKQIRQAILGDGTLSFGAKNVQVITNAAKVTLRGPVKSSEERARLGAIAARVAGEGALDNQIEVTH
jgi:hyperosmotically inducible periplasmic protein